MAEADAVLADTVAVAVFGASFLAAVFSSPSFFACTFESFRVAFSVGLVSALPRAFLNVTGFPAPSEFALAGTVNAFAAGIATTRARRFAAGFASPFRCTVAHALDALTMFAALLRAHFLFAANTSPFWFTDTSGVVNAGAVVVAILRAELKRAVGVGKPSIAVTLSVHAFSVVAALVRAGLDFAGNTGKTAFAEASAVVAHTASRAVARALGSGAIGAEEASVTVARQIDGTDTITRAFLGARLAAAIFTFVIVVALAHTLVTTSVVIALIRAGFAAACGTGESLVAHALATVAYTIATAFVGAAVGRRGSLVGARFFGAVFAFPSVSALAVLVRGAFSVTRATLRADLDSARSASKTGIALARAVFHAATVEVTHFWALGLSAIDATEQFGTLAGTSFGVAPAVV